MAFLSDITGLPQVWRVAIPTGPGEPTWPDQLTFGGDRVMYVEYSPVPGDGRLIFSRDVGGNENAQLYLLSADRSGEVPLTAGHETAMHIFGEWSDDGLRVLFAANRRDRGLFDLYVQRLGGEAEMVWENEEPGYLHNVRFSPDGQRAVVTRVQSSFHHELFEVDLQSGSVRAFLGAEGNVRCLGCAYAPDGQSLYLDTDLGADYLYIARLDLASGELETLAAPDWDCEAMCLAPDGTRLAYAVNVDGARRLHVLDLATGATREGSLVADVPGLLADGRLVFARSRRRRPRRISMPGTWEAMPYGRLRDPPTVASRAMHLLRHNCCTIRPLTATTMATCARSRRGSTSRSRASPRIPWSPWCTGVQKASTALGSTR